MLIWLACPTDIQKFDLYFTKKEISPVGYFVISAANTKQLIQWFSKSLEDIMRQKSDSWLLDAGYLNSLEFEL